MTSKSTDSDTDRIPFAAMLVLAAIGFTAITTELLPSGLLPQIGREFNISESQVGLLTVVYAGIIVFTVVPMSKLFARLPRNALLGWLVVAFALSNVLIAFSPVFPVAVAGRLVGGISHGLLWSVMAPYVASIVPDHALGRSMAVVFSGNSLGLALGTPAATALGSLVGWRGSFLVLAATGGVLAVLAFWLLPRVQRAPDAKRPSVRLAIRQPGVKAVTAAWPLLLLARFAMFTYIAPFILAAGLPPHAVSLSLSVVGGASFMGLWIAGLTVDSHPRRSILVAAGAVVAVYLLMPLAGTTSVGAYVLLGLWGAALGAAGIYNQSAILRAGKEHSDAANSLMVFATQLGIAIGAAYGGAALTVAGPLLVPVAAAVPAALAFLIILSSRKAGYPPGGKERGAPPAEPEPEEAPSRLAARKG